MTPRRFILGTAGHVDHGKTELVKTLTGWDTDRLKEEKERGISIELGFAPLKIDDETTIGIVDVPGHERFVKNMVAGAGGIDLAMLVIAADESIMPQTREHLEVLTSLAISSGVVVISKTDLMTEEMAVVLDEEIGEMVTGTFLDGAPVVRTSAKTGEGISELKQTLRTLADGLMSRSSDGPFRLAIDRIFHKQGIGVVITGSCYSGAVNVGDQVDVLPSRKQVRIRAIQSFGEQRKTGYAGERLAIALQGIKGTELTRGDMLVSPGEFVVSYMLDARLKVAEYARFEVRNRERIRFHHGAKEVLGRLALLGVERLRSGEEGLVQFRLETPVVAGEGDFFVVRKYSPSRVLGGGRVIDPQATKHKRRHVDEAVEKLHRREEGSPEDRLMALVEGAGLDGIDITAVDAEALRSVVDSGLASEIEGRLFDASMLQTLAAGVHEIAADYVRDHPLRYGIDKEELKGKLKFPHPTPLFNRVLEKLSEYRPIFVKGRHVRSDTAEITLSDQTARELDEMDAAIKKKNMLFPNQNDLQKEWAGSVPFREALQFLVDEGRVTRIDPDGIISTEALHDCLGKLKAWFVDSAELSVSDFKDLFDVTRKHAIPLLEYFDSQRFTRREGNVRTRGPGLVDIS